MDPPLALGVPYRLGDGWFDLTPLATTALTLLAARWSGLAWSRTTIGPLLAFGLILGYAVSAWGAVWPTAVAWTLLAAIAALVRRHHANGPPPGGLHPGSD